MSTKQKFDVAQKKFHVIKKQVAAAKKNVSCQKSYYFFPARCIIHLQIIKPLLKVKISPDP